MKNSSILIRNTLITNNEAERGGAMYIQQSAPDLISLEITGNTGSVGGGIYLTNTYVNIDNLTILGNSPSGISGTN